MADRQSPVDIPPQAPLHGDGLELRYGRIPLVLGDNPGAVQVDCTCETAAIIDGTLGSYNGTFQVVMTDNGEPGTLDLIGLTLWDNSGGLRFSSNWDGVQTLEQNLAGGNLVVHYGNGNLVAYAFGDTAPTASLVNYKVGTNIANSSIIALCEGVTCTSDFTIQSNFALLR